MVCMAKVKALRPRPAGVFFLFLRDTWRNGSDPALRAEVEGDGILTHVNEQLQLRSSFFGTFLCAVALPAQAAGGGGGAAAPGGASCLLPRLDVRSGSPIKMLIADFAGVPHRSSWRFVQLAAAHLAPYL